MSLAEEAHEAGGGEFGGEEAGAVAGEFSGGEAAAADGAFHGGGPAGIGPVAGDVEAGPSGGLRGAVEIEAGRDGEGGAGFLEDGALEQRGFADAGEEEFGLAQGGGKNLVAAHLDLRPGGTDNEFEVGCLPGFPAADSGLVEHPRDAGVEQDGVVEVRDFPVVPEVDGGDRRGDELVEGVLVGRTGCAGKRVEQVLGLAEAGCEDDGVGFDLGVAGLYAPASVLDRGDGFDAGVEAQIDAEGAGVVRDGLEELAERGGGDAEASGFGGAQEGFVEDLASVPGRAAFEDVVERASDDRFPEVADSAIGLAGALEPGGEAFFVGGRVAAKELHEASGDADFVAQGEHGGAEEAERVVEGGG